jgi:glycosyltransferase involved in cell wall biosynthesis
MKSNIINNSPLVCVRCMTFNHEAYIEDALNGFVIQQTTFPFVVAIINDASTDKTKSVINEFVENNCIYNPEIDLRIEDYGTVLDVAVKDNPRCIFHIVHLNENHYGKKSKLPYFAKYENAAKYVAMCEGDDYWTDPLKLQKQVDFMEANPGYVLCCHRYKIYNQNDGTWSDDYVKNMFELAPNGFSFTNKENLSHWATKTMTLLFRRAAMDKMPTRKIFRYWRDVHLNYYLLKEGPGYCFPFVGAVARRHSGGVFSSIGAMNQWRINLKVWNELVEHNREDDVLLSFYKSQHEGYRASVRNKIRDMRMYELLLDIRTLFYLDYHYGGVKEVIYSVKKILLSFWYLMKTKLNLK